MSTPPINTNGDGSLAQRIRAKYPGAYDDMDDATLEKAVVAKYPQYADLAKQGQQTDSLAGDVQTIGRMAKIAGKTAEDIGLTGGADPFEDLLKTAGQQTGIPFLESADKVNQALGTLQLAKRMHEAWQGLKQATIKPPGVAEALQPTGQKPSAAEWGKALISPPGTAEAFQGAQPRSPIQRGTTKAAAPPQPEDKQTEQPKEQADLEAEAELKAAQRKPENTQIWQAFPGDRGLSQLADHVIRMEGDSKIAKENNNPGNLKDPKTGEFQKFNSYEEGRSALIRQLNRWRDTNPDWTISDFNAVYAPDKSHGGDNPDGTEESRNRYLMKSLGE